MAHETLSLLGVFTVVFSRFHHCFRLELNSAGLSASTFDGLDFMSEFGSTESCAMLHEGERKLRPLCNWR